MLFNSLEFIFLFLPISLIGFFLLKQGRLIWLMITSLLFYAYWNPLYLPLMLFSILFNYQMGNVILATKPKSNQAKLFLGLGIGVNLLIIGYYKYADFFLDSLGINLSLTEIILPLAISFYTFTQIAYLVDVYRGETKETKYDLITYSLFVTFFPQLIAGPILRHDQLIPQLQKPGIFRLSQQNLAIGLSLFSLGLAKKVLIADHLSPWVSTVFNHSHEVVFIEAWVGVLAYTFQLYFDFSGYSDMAIGLGLLFNINLPINFNSPYKATSISDFWRRWHITLSNFLRDYLYISLGGNRRGEIRRYGNLLTTMLLGGLWHGAGWTFVLWGGLQGLYLGVNHAWSKLNKPLPDWLGWGLTFVAVVIGWGLFRAESLSDGIAIAQTLMGLDGIILPGEAGGKLGFITHLGIQLQSWTQLPYLPLVWERKSLSIVILAILTIIVTFTPNTQEIMAKFQPNWRWALVIGLLASISLLSLNRVSEFLYFQF